MKLLAVIALVCLCAGCKNNETPSEDGLGATLRFLLQERDSATGWTQDFSVATPPKSKSIPLTPDNIAAASLRTTGNSIAPELPGFGSLDTANISRDQWNRLNHFCGAVMGKNMDAATEDFNPATSFLVPLFFTDLETAGLTRFLVGKPWIIGETWQIPVRFFVGSRHLDIQVYLLYNNDRWVIDQISYGELADD
jgi:hypothetical protein